MDEPLTPAADEEVGRQSREASSEATGRLRSLLCPACGAALPWTVNEGDAPAEQHWLCPACGARADEPAAPLERRFEERTLRCWPYELEQLAQAEAVDGWYLVDTKAAADVAGTIEARFRRPRRATPQSPESGVAPQSASATRKSGEPHSAARPKAERRGPPQAAKRPAPERPAASEPTRSFEVAAAWWTRMVLGFLGLALALWLLDNFGLGGLLVALFVLWQIRRSGRRRGSRPR